MEQTKLVALRLLNTRAEPFAEEENHEIVKRISSEVYSHNHAISRTEAVEYIGLKQVKRAEDDDTADELWALYEEYRDLFQLEKPFLPEQYLISKNLEEHTWRNLNLACVESLSHFDICKQNVRVRRLRQVPPEVKLTVQLQGVNLPAINIPDLPPSISQEQINALVQQVAGTVIQQSMNTVIQSAISQAAQAAADRLVRSLPQAGFERLVFDSGWRRQR